MAGKTRKPENGDKGRDADEAKPETGSDAPQ